MPHDTLELRATLSARPGYNALEMDYSLWINGQEFGDAYFLNLTAIVQSCQGSGEFFMLTCTCGEPGCAGLFKGIQVTHTAEAITWVCQPELAIPVATALDASIPVLAIHHFAFDPAQYIGAIEDGIKNIQAMALKATRPVDFPVYGVSTESVMTLKVRPMPVNFTALQHALPVNGIEADWLARLTGLFAKKPPAEIDNDIEFLMPPAGQTEPYCAVQKVLATLYAAKGWGAKRALFQARVEADNLLRHLPADQQLPLFHGVETVKVPVCVPVRALLAHVALRNEVPQRLQAFLAHALAVTLRSPLVPYKGDLLRLSQLPDVPQANEMIEFFVGLPSDLCWNLPWQKEVDFSLFYRWREAIRPVAEHLESVLGQWVYEFADLDDELDDDYCHRFLALHCWCSLQPDSTLVQHLVKVTGASDVAHLKASLIDPANYTLDFTNQPQPFDMSPKVLQFPWRKAGHGHRVGIAFDNPMAQPQAEKIASLQWDCRVHFVMPHEHDTQRKPGLQMLLPDIADSIETYGEVEPIEFLAGIDELFIVIGSKRTAITGEHPDLHLSRCLEKLLWRAVMSHIPVHCQTADGFELENPEVSLLAGPTPETCNLEDFGRQNSQQPNVVRVWPEDMSSGLWTGGEHLGMIDYVDTDLPFALIRRLTSWQQMYDDLDQPNAQNDKQWDAFLRERMSVARALQRYWGARVRVEVQDGQGGWVAVRSYGRKPPKPA